MAKSSLSIQQVRQIIGRYSIAPVRSWLKRKGLPHTMTSREAMVDRVHQLLGDEKLTEDELIEASIGIEEASSKRTFLYRMSHSEKDLAKTEKQLKSLKVPLSAERAPVASPAMSSKLVYALDTNDEFRAKWCEQHIRTKADKRRRVFVDTKETKVIVLVADKKSGVVQIRYDKPDDKHLHLDNDQPTDQAYFDYYREQAENMLGLPLESLDFHAGLEDVLKVEPRVVRTNYTVDDAEDGCLTKRTQKKAGKDVRDTSEWKRLAKDPMVRTFEEAPLHWLPEMSEGKLNRELFSYADAARGFVRFDADCDEDEIEYVLGHLV